VTTITREQRRPLKGISRGTLIHPIEKTDRQDRRPAGSNRKLARDKPISLD